MTDIEYITDIEVLEISDLQPYEYNARIHGEEQIQALQASIKQFGFIGVVKIDEKNMILSGHGVIEALKRLGLTKVPCIRKVGLTDDEKSAFLHTDNKISELSIWDFDVLREDFSRISIDMKQFGFDNIMEEVSEINFEEAWQGMPEFEQDDATGCRKIIVHFKDWKDVNEFAKLVNQKITDKTKSIWYPAVPKEDKTGICYE